MKSNQDQTSTIDDSIDCKLSAKSMPKKGYETPELICYGDVRDVTLGPTVGTGESGCAVLAVGPPTLPCPF